MGCGYKVIVLHIHQEVFIEGSKHKIVMHVLLISYGVPCSLYNLWKKHNLVCLQKENLFDYLFFCIKVPIHDHAALWKPDYFHN